MRAGCRPRDDRGSSVVSVAILLAVVSLSLGAVAGGSALAARQRVVAAADASALAAADGASGAVAGTPCALAATVAQSNGVVVDDCRIDGAVASVSVSARVFGVTVRASARAGPPDAADPLSENAVSAP